MRSIILPLLVSAASATFAAAPNIAIYAHAFNGYTRTRLADNSVKPETYVFADGGHTNDIADPSFDHLSFYDVAHVIAGPLGQRGYVPSFDPKHTDLVVFVYWGMTRGSENDQFTAGDTNLTNALNNVRNYAPAGPGRPVLLGQPNVPLPAMGDGGNLTSAMDSQLIQAQILIDMFNDVRDEIDAKNATLLGYRENVDRAWSAPWMSAFRDQLKEVELDRYYVILVAVDYDTLVHKKAYKLMWESRISIPAHGNAFDEKLPVMAKAASRYFGEDLRRLVRDRIPEGKVQVGTPEVVEQREK